jgi:5,10-methylenetetrahydromethanopterin reductase
MVQISVGLAGNRPLGDYVALARLAEDFTIAGRTERIRLGTSVANPYLIHPAILAEHAALLDEATNGRAYLGIGRGAFLDSLQPGTPCPLTTVREAIELAQHLLRGETQPYEGQAFRTTSSIGGSRRGTRRSITR